MSEIKTPPKRLIGLNPNWAMTEAGSVYGLTYDCPCDLPRFEILLDADGKHTVGADGKVVGVVPYDQCCPRDGRECVPTKGNFIGKPVSPGGERRGWSITGDSFENLTLSPSVHAVGHWHGWIQNGMVTSC